MVDWYRVSCGANHSAYLPSTYHWDTFRRIIHNRVGSCGCFLRRNDVSTLSIIVSWKLMLI